MRVCAMVLAMLAVCVPARASVILFATRAQFRVAAGPLRTEGFEQCRRTTTAFVGPLDAAHPGEACRAGALAPGLRLSDDGGPAGNTLYLAAPGYAANRTRAIGQNGPASDALALDFTSPTRAVAFDVFQNFGGGAQIGHAAPFAITLYAADAVIGRWTLAVPSGRGAFFGAISERAAITRAEINNPLAYDLVDNIAFASRSLAVRSSFASASPAPEPDSLMLLLLGSGLAATVRRR